MNILINAVSARLGGGQTYVCRLLENLPTEFKGKIYVLAPDSLKLPDPESVVVRLPVPSLVIRNPFFRVFWEKVFVKRQINNLKIDVLFCPGGLLSTRCPPSCKQVVTFQNMLPFDNDQLIKYGIGYSRLRNMILRRQLMKSMQQADLVIFISRYAQEYIVEKSLKKIRKFVVIPHGVDLRFYRCEKTRLTLPEWFRTNNYLLYVSALDVYKSQCEVVRAYKLLKDSMGSLPNLILIGHHFPHYTKQVRNLVDNLGLSNEIIMYEHIEYTQLPAIYQNAQINLFMSQTENCPFILLEAMASGTPLVASNMGPMPEFGGDAVLYCNPMDPQDIASKIAIFLNNETMRMDYAEKALSHSERFQWKTSASDTWHSMMSLN
jgi:glycosyltransferase involved in cell wall biosynthesis